MRGAAIDVIQNDALEFHLHFLPLFDASPRTLRVGKRYGNALSFALPLLRGEARTVDVLLIEALRVFAPQVHAALPQHRDVLLGEHDFGWGSGAQERRVREKQQWDELLALAEPSDRRPVADMLEHLFPRVLRFTRNTSYGPEWNTNWSREQRIASPLYFDRYFQYAVPPNDISDEMLRRLLAELDRRELEAAVKTFDGAVDEANADRAIEKLRIHEDTLSASQAASLVKLILDRGPALPNERTFLGSPPRKESVVLLFKAMLRAPADERKSLAIAAVSEPTPLAFSLDCLHWFEHSKERDDREIARLFSRDDERTLGDLLAARVRERMQSEPLYLGGEPGTAARLISFWADAVSEEDRAAFFLTRFARDPFEAGQLLDALAMRAITSQNRHLPPTIEREQYHNILKVVDPELLIRYLRRAYGDQAEPTKYDSLARDVEDEEDGLGGSPVDEKLRLVRRFILLHEKAIKSRVEITAPASPPSEALPEQGPA